MRWKGRRISTNMEDRRGGGGKAGGISIIGLVVAFVAWKFFGVDPQQAYRATQAVTNSQSAQEGSAPEKLTAGSQSICWNNFGGYGRYMDANFPTIRQKLPTTALSVI